MSKKKWYKIGKISELKEHQLQEVVIDNTKIALSYEKGKFGAVSGICNHVGGPLGKGRLEGNYIVCPWHNWTYDRISGLGHPGAEESSIPRYEIQIKEENLYINLNPLTKRNVVHHPPHALERPIKREKGRIRVAGISTTAMDVNNPRYSTSENLLDIALKYARSNLNAQTIILRLGDLKFRNCEGYYSKSAHACTWPCSITQMDDKDQMDKIYEALVFWADVILIATPIRWGSASSLYYKMVERMNCIQNQITINNKILIQNKVAAFIITGGQDNIQSVAGQMLMFFSELGFSFPTFPFIATSRGWSAEDMENNIKYVKNSKDLGEGAKDLVKRSIQKAKKLIADENLNEKMHRGGRKAHQIHLKNNF